jgi:hypothetical protein
LPNYRCEATNLDKDICHLVNIYVKCVQFICALANTCIARDAAAHHARQTFAHHVRETATHHAHEVTGILPAPSVTASVT